MNTPYRIILAGTPNTTVIVGEALVQTHHTIIGVICPFPKPVGRKQIVTPCELEQWAVSKHIPVFHVDRIRMRDASFPSTLPSADFLVVADFGFLIPPAVLNFPKYGAFNLHPSLLPRWRGATPVPFTILAGETTTGTSIIQMSEAFDTGAVVAQQSFDIPADAAVSQVLTQAFTIGADILVPILSQIAAGKIKSIPQTIETPTPVTYRFTKEDGYISYSLLKDMMDGSTLHSTLPFLDKFHFTTNVPTVLRMLRALNPWPGVWTTLPNGKRIKLLSGHEKNGLLLLDKVQLEGKTETQFKDVKHYFAAAGATS